MSKKRKTLKNINYYGDVVDIFYVRILYDRFKN